MTLAEMSPDVEGNQEDLVTRLGIYILFDWVSASADPTVIS